jgi:hypothetical protein
LDDLRFTLGLLAQGLLRAFGLRWSMVEELAAQGPGPQAVELAYDLLH